ncbi:allophanate hydrolase subunit 1, partial [Pseudomonas sp. CM27]|uniref:5-oxoprolinase subunit B family protein n=1 Tax=Pseudomonas sp. CM27 TaxID=2738452 RepID=UPI001554AC9E
MNPRVEVVAFDSLMVRLFERIDEANMSWMLAASQRLSVAFGEHLLDLVPSYTTLMVQFDLPPGEARALIKQALDGLRPDAGSGGRRHEIPVWYHASVGPELPVLAARSGLSEAEVIRLHGERDYPVFALGFAPGFGFMGLVDERLASPRLSTPRKRVAAGSVGIAERQTAAYPAVSP